MGLFRLMLLAALVYFVMRSLKRLAPNTAPAAGAPPPPQQRTPWEILEVAPGASDEQIRAAYQRLVRQYHPDRLEGLAPELRALAEERTKEINRAYEALKRR